MKSPMRPHHTKIAPVWREEDNHEIAAKFLLLAAKSPSSAQFSLFFEPPEPRLRLRRYVLRRGSAIADAALDRRFHRKPVQGLPSNPRLDRLHVLQRELMQRY